MAEVGASERDVNATGGYLIERAGRYLWSGTRNCLQVSVKTSCPLAFLATRPMKLAQLVPIG